MLQVYQWMSAALLVTAFTAALAAGQGWAGNPVIMVVALVGQLGLVLFLSFRLHKLQPATAISLFFVYSALMGVTLSVYLLIYTASSVAGAFLSTAALFGAMSIVGATTKVDLTKFGAFLLMGLIGLLVALIVNIFLASSALAFAISLFGVLLFTALTAYDTQRIGQMASMVGDSGDKMAITRVALMGALTLYLDFVNLFIYLLRLIGDRR
jgi:FtsH-binding integral membrane protein